MFENWRCHRHTETKASEWRTVADWTSGFPEAPLFQENQAFLGVLASRRPPSPLLHPHRPETDHRSDDGQTNEGNWFKEKLNHSGAGPLTLAPGLPLIPGSPWRKNEPIRMNEFRFLELWLMHMTQWACWYPLSRFPSGSSSTAAHWDWIPLNTGEELVSDRRNTGRPDQPHPDGSLFPLWVPAPLSLPSIRQPRPGLARPVGQHRSTD